MHSTAFVNITSHSQYRKMFFYFLTYLFKFEDRNNLSHKERPVKLRKDYTQCLRIKDCISFQDVWILRVGTRANQHHRPPPGRTTASLPPVSPSAPPSQPHRPTPPPPPTSATAAAHLRACSTPVSRRHQCHHRAPSPLQLGIPYFATSLGSLILIHFFIVASFNLTWFFLHYFKVRSVLCS
jgi:hypothetical protein